MKKFATIFFFLFAIAFWSSAESNVYVFLKSVGNSDVNISLNGEKLCDLNGSIKKEMGASSVIQHELLISNDCFRKIEIEGEGKIRLSLSMEYANPMAGTEKTFSSDVSFEVENGKSYYFEVTNKGLSDIILKEMSEKNAVKKIKKWEELPSVKYSLVK
ncbi:MAG: hypothetical protein K2G90_08955 [Muribaculaceae bacterium]|nr:hypothetical protein [Muribaculaceae bacterium]